MSFASLIDEKSTRAGLTPAPNLSTFGEIAGAAWDMQSTGFNVNSAINVTADAYNEREDKVKERFGVSTWEVAGTRQKLLQRPVGTHEGQFDPGGPGRHFGDKSTDAAIDAWIAKGRATEPEKFKDIKTSDELRLQAIEVAQMSQKAYEDTVLRNPSALTRISASLFGSIGASFKDPLNLATLPIGFGASKNILKAAAMEGVLNAAVETASIPFVQKWQTELGHKYGFGEAAEAVGGAFLGGAALTTVFKGAVPAFRKAAELTGSASQYVLDKVAGNSALPRSVRDAAAYMSRAAHIDENIPPSILERSAGREEETLVTHRETVKNVSESFEEYKAPRVEEIGAPNAKSLPQGRVDPEIMAEVQAIRREIEVAESAAVNNKNYKEVVKALGYKPKTLSQFIKETGGIVDDGGELAARDINHKSLPGLVRKGVDDKGAVIPGLDGGSVKSAQQIDYVKERVYDAGYFPEKNSYDEISNSELMDALAQDVAGNKRYTREDADAIAEMMAPDGVIDGYQRAGIIKEMSDEEIADVLRQRRAYENDMTPPESTPGLPRQQFKEMEIDKAAEADFERLLKENGNVTIKMDDGRSLSLRQLREEMDGDKRLVEAMKVCALG